MRLFATGAINWVMGKALPDDIPLEAKMVSKAIERAQTTVEQKNGEIRKNVLKYDEVMNEQRKVVYALRDQILDKRDLRDRILDEYLPEAVQGLVDTYCVADFHEEWDLTGLHTEVLTFWPTSIADEAVSDVRTTKELYDLLLADAQEHFERREEELGADVMRQVERQVMLRIIDTKWREHLYEMDYLQEGINLRAMGQRDPLTEWQREGFEMFGQMMHAIAQDLVRYVMHVQVSVTRSAPQPKPVPVDDGTPRVPAFPAAVADSVDAERADTTAEGASDEGNAEDLIADGTQPDPADLDGDGVVDAVEAVVGGSRAAPLRPPSRRTRTTGPRTRSARHRSRRPRILPPTRPTRPTSPSDRRRSRRASAARRPRCRSSGYSAPDERPNDGAMAAAAAASPGSGSARRPPQ